MAHDSIQKPDNDFDVVLMFEHDTTKVKYPPQRLLWCLDAITVQDKICINTWGL